MNHRLLSFALLLPACGADPKPEPRTPEAPVTEVARFSQTAPPSGAAANVFARIDAAGSAPAAASAALSGTPPSAGAPPMVGAAPGSAAPERLEATVGATFTLDLASNPTTGYQWQVCEPLDAHFSLVSNTYESTPQPNPDRPLVGSGGTAHLTFNAVSPGTAILNLEYVRPWEKGRVEPCRAWEVTIR